MIKKLIDIIHPISLFPYENKAVKKPEEAKSLLIEPEKISQQTEPEKSDQE